ncbi:MAG: gliding motility-associated C-terminal domain-containing protein, partial [Bacteroidota bacterium]
GHTVEVFPSQTTEYTLIEALPVSGPCEVLLTKSNVTITVSQLEVDTEVLSNFGGYGISCAGEQDGAIQASAKFGVGEYEFLWSDGSTGTELSGLPFGKYYVTVSDETGCAVIDSVVLEAPAPIEATIVANDPDCFGDEYGNVLVENIAGGAGGYTLTIDGETFNVSTFPQTLPLIKIGSYDAVLQDQNGCAQNVALTIEAPVELNAEFVNPEIRIDEGTSTGFDLETNFDVSRVEWNIDTTLSCLNCLDALATPESSTRYTITVYDELGCFVTADVNVLVNKFRDIFVPAAFTPNDDQTNDELYIHTKPTVSEIRRLEIYDRWGNKVFEQFNFPPNDATYGWDGTFRGDPMNNGLFVYYLTVVFKDGLEKNFQGEITLIR